MRVLIITDSLGVPRSNIPVEKTWTYQFMYRYSTQGHVFYTMTKHGLYSSQLDFEQISDINPDLVICQIGIVDCVRRTMSNFTLKVVSHIPLVRNVIHKIVKKYHYKITSVIETHRCSPDLFNKNIQKLCDICKNIYFIRIADAGLALKKQVYNCQSDIDRYNSILKEHGKIIDPYNGKNADEYLLEDDGHHLNDLGNSLVYKSVCEVFDAQL